MPSRPDIAPEGPPASISKFPRVSCLCRRFLGTGFLGCRGEEVGFWKERGGLRAAAPAVAASVPRAMSAGGRVPAQSFVVFFFKLGIN